MQTSYFTTERQESGLIQSCSQMTPTLFGEGEEKKKMEKTGLTKKKKKEKKRKEWGKRTELFHQERQKDVSVR